MDELDIDAVVDYLKAKDTPILDIMNAFYIASEEYEANFRLLPGEPAEETYICKRMMEMLDEANSSDC